MHAHTVAARPRLKSDHMSNSRESHTCSSRLLSISNTVRSFFSLLSYFLLLTVCRFQIGIFPEGTCTNRSGLIRFKAGTSSRTHGSGSDTCWRLFVGVVAGQVGRGACVCVRVRTRAIAAKRLLTCSDREFNSNRASAGGFAEASLWSSGVEKINQTVDPPSSQETRPSFLSCFLLSLWPSSQRSSASDFKGSLTDSRLFRVTVRPPSSPSYSYLRAVQREGKPLRFDCPVSLHVSLQCLLEGCEAFTNTNIITRASFYTLYLQFCSELEEESKLLPVDSPAACINSPTSCSSL